MDRTDTALVALTRRSSRPHGADRWTRRAAVWTIAGLSTLLWVGIGALIVGA